MLKKDQMVGKFALFMSVLVISLSVTGSYNKAYATGADVVIGGGVVAVSAGEALAYLLGAFGLTAASSAVYENVDNIKAWGQERIKDFEDFCEKSNEWSEVTALSLDTWITNVGNGVLDKSSDVWNAFKSWCSSLHSDIINSDVGGEVTADNIYSSSQMNGYIYKNISPIINTNRDTMYTIVGESDYYVMFRFSNHLNSSGREFADFYIASLSPYKVYSKNLSSGKEILYYDKKDFDTMTINGSKKEYYQTSFGGAYGTLTSDGIVTFIPGINYVISETYNKEVFVREILFGDVIEVPQQIGDTTYILVDTGITDVYDRDKDYANVDWLNPGAVSGSQDVEIDWKNVGDIPGVIGGIASGTIGVTDALDQAGVTVVDRETDKTIDNTGITDIPVTDVVVDTTQINDYTIGGLESFFPFCLPFDLIDFINVLSAPPQAPHFEYPIKYKGKDGFEEYVVDIDLSPFDPVASLLRDMECLLFIVGLIILTRDKMIRG